MGGKKMSGTERTLGEEIEYVYGRYEAYYNALDEESDRAVAILVVAHFENCLRGAIIEKFVDLSNELRDKIFEGNGPLSTFAAKMDIACALGVYDKKTLTDLRKIKNIRNDFAHSSEPIDFDHKGIVDRCQNIDILKTAQGNTLRERFQNCLWDLGKSIYPELLPGCKERG